MLSEIFMERVDNKGAFNLFINSPQKYLKKYIKQRKLQKWKDFRRNIIQIRINRNEMKIKIFGKVLFERK